MKLEWGLMIGYAPALLDGLKLTVLLACAAMLLALVLGGTIAAMRRSGFKLVERTARVYTEMILGIPVLVLMYVIFFVLPSFGLLIDPITTGVVTLMLYYSPYVAEVIRGALNAIATTQIEAAHAIGMPSFRIMQRILLPQAIGLMLPPLTGLFIGLLKDTALLSVISVPELTFQAKQAVSRTYAPFEIYVLVAVGYWVLNYSLEQSLRRFEYRITRYRTI